MLSIDMQRTSCAAVQIIQKILAISCLCSENCSYMYIKPPFSIEVTLNICVHLIHMLHLYRPHVSIVIFEMVQLIVDVFGSSSWNVKL